ncbi:hypothetical protein LINPERPRIM_LOCUS30867 [Linum perenne]
MGEVSLLKGSDGRLDPALVFTPMMILGLLIQIHLPLAFSHLLPNLYQASPSSALALPGFARDWHLCSLLHQFPTSFKCLSQLSIFLTGLSGTFPQMDCSPSSLPIIWLTNLTVKRTLDTLRWALSFRIKVFGSHFGTFRFHQKFRCSLEDVQICPPPWHLPFQKNPDP